VPEIPLGKPGNLLLHGMSSARLVPASTIATERWKRAR